MSNMIPRYDTKLFTQIWDNAADFVHDYKNVGIPTTISDTNANTLYYLLYARYGNNPIANYDEEQFKYKVMSIIFQYGPTWEKRLGIQTTLRGLQIGDIISDGFVTDILVHNGNSSSNSSSAGTTSRNTSSTASNTGNVSVATNSSTENIKNNALNPSTTPATNSYEPLSYINAQEAQKNDLLGNQTTTNNLLNNASGNESGNMSNNASAATMDAFTDNRSRTISAGKLKGYERLLALLDSDVTGEFISKFRICFKQFVMPERTWIYVTEVEEDEEDED